MSSEAGAAKFKCSSALCWEASKGGCASLLSLLLGIFQQVKLRLVVTDCEY